MNAWTVGKALVVAGSEVRALRLMRPVRWILRGRLLQAETVPAGMVDEGILLPPIWPRHLASKPPIPLLHAEVLLRPTKKF